MYTADLTAFFDKGLWLILLVLLLFFMIHSAVVAYHWLTFGSSKHYAFLGAVIHIGVGLALFAVMALLLLF